MSIQWRWTRSAINNPWQDRSRGGDEEGEGKGRERNEMWKSKEEKRREEVSERTGSMDWFIRQAVAFFPLYIATSVALRGTTRPLLHFTDLQPIWGRHKKLAAFNPQLASCAATSGNVCDCSPRMALFIMYQSRFNERCISSVSV